MFLSTFLNSLDGKKRIVIPRSFRTYLKDNAFIAFRSYQHNAIDCFSVEKMQSLVEKIDSQMDFFSPNRDSFETAVFADSVALNFDKDGRVILPEELIEYANLKGEIAIVGKGSTFQIWEATAFKQYQENARKEMRK